MIIAIIQARMSSTRCHRKVSRPIADHPMLWWVVRRARLIRGLAQVMVATSTDPSDDWIAEMCALWKVDCVRGELQDVLGRYEQAAQVLKLGNHDGIVRLTADCPALDPKVSAQVIQQWQHTGADYASNLRDWPDGLDTEVFTRAALRDAFHMASGDEDREHVTPWMRRNLFCVELPHNPPLRHVKFSVDTEEELEYVRELYAALGPDFQWGWGQILTVKPENLCALCRDGIPHAQRARTSIGGPRAYTVWDLHETTVAGGSGIEECIAWAIHARAASLPRLTVGVQTLGVSPPKNPNADQASRQSGSVESASPGDSPPSA